MEYDIKNMEEFNKLIEDQFVYGGKKYGLNDERESTDVLFEKHGKNWLYGTMNKYTFRYKNLQRERDLLKISTYCFILWLKRGYWVDKKGLIDVLDTTVKIKTREFPNFIKTLDKYISSCNNAGIIQQVWLEQLENEGIKCISDTFIHWSNIGWQSCYENSIFKVYYMCFLIWSENYSQEKEHDTDTRNEETAEK